MIRPMQFIRRNDRPAQKHRRFRGGSVLEAAFIVPILVSLAFGMAEFSYFFFVKHTLEGAAREGARNAITPSATNTTVTTAVNNAISAAGGNSWGTVVNITDTSGGALNVSGLAAGTAIQIKLVCTWSTIGVHPLGIIPGTKQVIGTCVMRKEG